MIRREHLAGPPHARLDFVHHQQHPVPRGQLAQPVQERRRRHDVAALALDRLDDDRGDLVGRGEVHEELLGDERQALRGTRVGAAVEAIGIRVRRVVHARHERPEAAPLDRLAGGQRQRAQRSAVKRAEERDDPLPLRVIARQLDRRLGRLGAGVGEERADVAVDRRDRGERLGQPDLRLVVEVRPRHVDELLRLIGDRAHDVGMRDAGRVDRDAGGAIEEAVAVDVLDHRPFAAGDHERIVARVGGRDVLRVALDDRPGLRAGQRRPDVWRVHLAACGAAVTTYQFPAPTPRIRANRLSWDAGCAGWALIMTVRGLPDWESPTSASTASPRRCPRA